MKNRIWYSLAIASLLATLSFDAAATTMRCGTHVIQGGGRHGPTMYEVLKKCGSPSERHAYFWLYKFNRSVYRLNFSSQGILNSIQRVG